MQSKKCATKFCRRKRAPNRTLCHRCRNKKYAQRNKIVYAFNVLKSNAKRRCKEFTLTLDEFKTFCTNTGYINNKGTTSNSMTIDRIDNSRGYSFDNIRVLTLSENVRNMYVYYRSNYKTVTF